MLIMQMFGCVFEPFRTWENRAYTLTLNIMLPGCYFPRTSYDKHGWPFNIEYSSLWITVQYY